jgi:carboxymethylenebutenolidase
MPDIEFSTSAGPTSGYFASPAGEQGPAVIVLQEWWGLEEHIRSVCDRFAEEGFFALAPDLYGGETTTQPSEAEQKLMALSMEKVEPQMCGAAEYLAEHPGHRGDGVGAIGFCLGGGLAMWAATTCPNVTAVVSYYYVLPHAKPDFSKLKGPVLGHFGTADEFVPLESAKALEREIGEAGGEVTFHYYEGNGHAFFNELDRLGGTYDPEAAKTSWERSLGFLREALAPGN